MERPDPLVVRTFILQQLPEHAADIVRLVAGEFSISRQAAHAHVAKLVKEGLVESRGQTRTRTYALATSNFSRIFPFSEFPEEDMVWHRFVSERLAGLPENVLTICYHGFTEMLNNAIDHSEAQAAMVEVARSDQQIIITISDIGIGIFEKIRVRFGLEDQRQAILELSKGKLTTDPTRHSGEGIYFTSRMFDKFSILSGKLYFSHDTLDGDWLIEDQKDRDVLGTVVSMKIAANSIRTSRQIYEEHIQESQDDEFAFSRTHVPLSLAVYGTENLVSRSQAKRVLRRFDRFKEVLLDFHGIHEIGQAFADEIFRVFKLSSPQIKVIAINTTPRVKRMIRRAIAALKEMPGGERVVPPFVE